MTKGIIELLRKGGVAVLPTDTIYGICGLALRPTTVKRIYRLRKRNQKKPMIVLIGAVHDIKKFGVAPDARAARIVKKVWPGKVSVLLPVARGGAGTAQVRKRFSYLHRGTEQIAFRLPRPAWLRALLKKSGPLVAPSANIEGKPPAQTVQEAFAYFGNHVDGYVDAGRLAGAPSTLIATGGGAKRGAVKIVRQGAARIARNIFESSARQGEL